MFQSILMLLKSTSWYAPLLTVPPSQPLTCAINMLLPVPSSLIWETVIPITHWHPHLMVITMTQKTWPSCFESLPSIERGFYTDQDLMTPLLLSKCCCLADRVHRSSQHSRTNCACAPFARDLHPSWSLFWAWNAGHQLHLGHLQYDCMHEGFLLLPCLYWERTDQHLKTQCPSAVYCAQGTLTTAVCTSSSTSLHASLCVLFTLSAPGFLWKMQSLL